MQLAINGVEMTEMVFEIAEPSNMAAWVMATIAALLLILGLFLGWLAFSFGHPSVVLTDEDLRLNVPLYGRTIPNAEIAVNQARIVDLNNEPPLNPRFRTNGIGLPGYRVGWFRLRNGDRALVAITRPKQVLYVPTRDYSLLLSVAEPEELLQALQSAE
ncbi:MAG: hypothetical protein CMP98_08105 [Gammaproteobacteria bacterium]|nr:hypothetical protein [Gammaproteobacteria bacterium]OUU09432.1 MAG: hypothetical protein CBB94_08265 [Gammaproteobacteria bacterium TMED34]|tara:strand:+ start:1704 stop:2180 length:477 start_codon:yes stop_codon:yes gene_type:complete